MRDTATLPDYTRNSHLRCEAGVESVGIEPTTRTLQRSVATLVHATPKLRYLSGKLPLLHTSCVFPSSVEEPIATLPGFEPRLKDSKSSVLPLHHRAIKSFLILWAWRDSNPQCVFLRH